MEKITKIYLGRDKVCRCGCAGEYTYPGEPKFEKRVKRFLKKWESYSPSKDDVCEGVYMNLSYGQDRALTAYFD